MITNQQLAKLIEEKLNGPYVPELREYANIHAYGLDVFTPNVRYEFHIFANDGEYIAAENRGAQISAGATNTVTQYINGVLKTPGGASVEGSSAETYNAAVDANIELLIPNCDDVAFVPVLNATLRLQDAVEILVGNALSLPSTNIVEDNEEMVYSVGARYSHAALGEKRNRTQVGLSVILNLFVSFAIVAMGISSRQIELTINGEAIYFNRISISRTSVQENNVSAEPNAATPTVYGVSKARTTATQLFIGFSAPVRPTALNDALVRYILLGEVTSLAVTLTIPTSRDASGNTQTLTGTYTMTFSEGGIAGEENLNASYDIRLAEEMTEVI